MFQRILALVVPILALVLADAASAPGQDLSPASRPPGERRSPSAGEPAASKPTPAAQLVDAAANAMGRGAAWRVRGSVAVYAPPVGHLDAPSDAPTQAPGGASRPGAASRSGSASPEVAGGPAVTSSPAGAGTLTIVGNGLGPFLTKLEIGDVKEDKPAGSATFAFDGKEFGVLWRTEGSPPVVRRAKLHDLAPIDSVTRGAVHFLAAPSRFLASLARGVDWGPVERGAWRGRAARIVRGVVRRSEPALPLPIGSNLVLGLDEESGRCLGYRRRDASGQFEVVVDFDWSAVAEAFSASTFSVEALEEAR